jgi:hypothetical protein
MVAPRDWGDGLRRRIKMVRCRPTSGGWLIQVLDAQGRVLGQRTAQVSRTSQVDALLHAEGILITHWWKSVTHGVEWRSDARMIARI